jgi:hypothetical protein
METPTECAKLAQVKHKIETFTKAPDTLEDPPIVEVPPRIEDPPWTIDVKDSLEDPPLKINFF